MSTTFMGGKLKLKGGVDVSQLKGGVKKKKKKTSVPSDAIVPVVNSEQQQQQDGGSAGGDQQAQAGEGKSPVVAVTREGAVLDPSAVTDRRTEAEKKADEHFLKYEEMRARKAAAKSHRERIKELNEKLANLTEHNDIFRISYTA